MDNNDKLNFKTAKADIIKEEFYDIDNIPNWMGKLKVQGFIGKSLYFILLVFR